MQELNPDFEGDFEKMSSIKDVHLKQLIQREDKLEKLNENNIDSSQLKENFYKEELMKQIKIGDPNAQQQAQVKRELTPYEVFNQLDSYFEIFNIMKTGINQLYNEDDKHKLKSAQADINQYLDEITTEGNEW